MGPASNSASDIVMLGECLHALQNPQVYRPDLYAKETGNFYTLLERVGLTSTRRLAESLAGLSIPADRDGMISRVASRELTSRGSSDCDEIVRGDE
jgi:hypothetical protein